ncbi:MAG TPA: xanthine dehydrogenase family protein molybdopterin-binding subunit [Chloroflexota bacterium]|nr:xanthine dehydrogenase family protein molybdopterin-binding subunit [Chloroflexota bacterium]
MTATETSKQTGAGGAQTNGQTDGVHQIGRPVPRVDALEKVTGRAQYTADLHLPGMCHGVFLRSPYAHARITSIDVSEAERMPGVVAVITADTLAKEMAIVVEEEQHAARRVQRLFPGVGEKVKYHGAKVAAVAAMTREIAEEACERIKVEYELLPPVTDVREAIKPGAPLVNEESEPAEALSDGPFAGHPLHNVAGQNHRSEGDVEAGFNEADRIFEDTYVIPRAHQTYIEPQTTIADVAPDGKVTVWTSTQGHFAVRSNLANSLRIPASKINVHGMTVGGGFGAKFGGIVDTYCVLLAQKARRPVKMVYSRHEEFLDARPAPGAVITVKTGVKQDGTIVARQAWALWDTGAGSGGCYATTRVKGVYNVPHFKSDAYDINTNKPAPGAYRAPGAPQATFAGETQLNRICQEMGFDPVEFRLKNMREGEQIAFKETLEAVAKRAGWAERKAGEYEGWGVAVGEWTNGAGPAGAVVSVHEDGKVRIFYGLMDLTGTDTAMAQIAAEVLGVAYEDVTVVRGDTDSAPFGTSSGGSVVTFSFGNAVKRAAEDARNRVLELAAEHLEASIDDLTLAEGKVSVKGDPETSVTLAQLGQMSLRSRSGPIVGRGSFSSEPSATTISAQVGKVRVDPQTGQIRLLELYGSLDVGKAINPLACEGQMEGGLVQGFAWGLMEQMRYAEDGRNWNAGLLDYRVPTALDFPDIESVMVEVPTKNGPFGVKGIGEPPIAPGVAALVSAVADATGVWINEVPLTPERVLTALKSKQS